jgi:hypothetical protein
VVFDACAKFNNGKSLNDNLLVGPKLQQDLLDYCGPILIKTHRGRGKQKTIKAYVCLFVCLSTKAIHVELVSDLTADTFLDALKRFVSRRGTVKSIISENSTNFIKANKDLIDLHQFFQNFEISRKLVTTLSNENIKWKFIPPRTSNFGGFEAGVKSVKYHTGVRKKKTSP